MVKVDLLEEYLSALKMVRSLRAMTLQRKQGILMLHNHQPFLLSRSVAVAVQVV